MLWINSHGFLVLGIYYLVISVLGTMPQLPDNASYLEKWGFAIANAICGNAQKVLSSLQSQQIQPPTGPNQSVTKTETKQTTIENKTD